jgi:7-carboxy-7-deazaguanine synthase
MFGLNTKVGKQYFNEAGDKLFVTSIFFTIQGEGPYRGKAALFVRLAKCNLGCSWCDAFFEDGDWLTVPEVMQRADAAIKDYFKGEVPSWAQFEDSAGTKPRKMVFVVTGGEPTLQPNLFDLLSAASREYKWTQIESNGVLAPIVPDTTTVVVSPKCMEKVDVSEGFKRYIPTSYLTPNPDTLARADCLKFIVEDQPDFDSPYQSIPDWAHEWHKTTGRDIFISPMNIYKREPEKAKQIRAGNNKPSLEERSMYDEVVSWWTPDLFDMEANQRNHEHAARYALANGYVFQMQLHLFCAMA